MELQFEVDSLMAGKRLDQVLKNFAPQLSRARLQKAVRDGCCCLDGLPVYEPDRKLSKNQKVLLQINAEKSELEAENEPVEIIWHDDSLAVCNKPPGLTVHPCPSCTENTLVQRMLHRFPQLAELGGERPGIVHRLDKDTSGLMLIALTEAARLKLCDDFASRNVHKKYLALVYGQTPDCGECNEPVGRHPKIKTKMAVLAEKQGGRPARTVWKTLWRSATASLLEVDIFTGRTHQIRVHLAHQGYPILGDQLYASEKIGKLAPRQMLHAWQLEFTHPQTGRNMRFTQPVPEDFISAAINSANFTRRIIITGNPGSGKSLFGEYLQNLSVPAISADKIVEKLYQKNGHAAEWLTLRLGDAILNANGDVDKKALFAILQKRPELKVKLERFVHALVADEIASFWQNKQNEGSKFVAAEIPLYFECGWQNKFRPKPFVIGVNSNRETRWQRIAQNRGWPEHKIQAIESWQWQDEKKMAACDLVVDNHGDAESLARQSQAVLQKLQLDYQKEREELAAKLRGLCGYRA